MDDPADFDPRGHLSSARAAVQTAYVARLTDFGQAGNASKLRSLWMLDAVSNERTYLHCLGVVGTLESDATYSLLDHCVTDDAETDMDVASQQGPLSPFEQIRAGREIIRAEARALEALSARVDAEFDRAVSLIHQCRGCLIVTGMGKAGLIGQKIAATLASTGTRSHYLHPGEAVHGDLGRVGGDDTILILSQSGQTEEVLRLVSSLRQLKVPIIAMTGRPDSELGAAADITLDLGDIEEAGTLGLAPSTSTTAMLAMGDALALVVCHKRGFGPEDFAQFHPGGSLGRKLSKVEDVMRTLDECRVASERKSVREVMVEASRPGRRVGAVLLVDDEGSLSGIFTDSDLARLLEGQRDETLDHMIADVMTRDPFTVPVGTRLPEAVEQIVRQKISELPVCDVQGRPIGVIDVTDVVGILPGEQVPAQDEKSAQLNKLLRVHAGSEPIEETGSGNCS